MKTEKEKEALQNELLKKMAQYLNKNDYRIYHGTVSYKGAAKEILALPSDYVGMTIGDVLEKFDDLVNNHMVECFSCMALTREDDRNCKDCYSDKLLTFNGQPIRRTE